MQIDARPPKHNYIIEITIIASILVHVLFWAFLTNLGTRPISSSYLAGLVSDPNARTVPTPTPEPTPPPPPTPKPKPTPPPKNEDLPPPNKEVKDVDETEPPKPIFGVTEESVVENSDWSVRVGNTLMKKQEKEFTDPSQVRPYSGGSVKSIKASAPPKIIKMIPPDYPTLAKQAGREGRVVLKVLISGRSGKVLSASIVKADPPGFGFEQAAMNAIKEWLYSAPGGGSDVWFFQPIKFNLEG